MQIQEDARTKLDNQTKSWRYINIQFTLSPACPETAIIKWYENKIFDQMANFISIKTEYRWS